MSCYLITGVAGTGKTTIAQGLCQKGIVAFDLDVGFCGWHNTATGLRVDHPRDIQSQFYENHAWLCNKDMLARKMAENKDRPVVAVGIATNQDELLELFDGIFLLQCQAETISRRLQTRTNNSFGKHPHEYNSVLTSYLHFNARMLERGATPILNDGDAEQAIAIVFQTLKRHYA